MKARLLRVILDTNIIVSAVLTRDGLESGILRLALNREIELYLSWPILNEYMEVLARPKFGLGAIIQQQIIEGIKSAGTLVVPQGSLMICSDPADNIFLECAETARANYLVTGNKRHFPVAWKSCRIVSSRDFLASISI